ncbi:MAG: hypothetical protein NE334_18905 [Lentisphaeraceae bacterium]|nr:hypothetical protein [Lentisphaeraceae bacterium]
MASETDTHGKYEIIQIIPNTDGSKLGSKVEEDTEFHWSDIQCWALIKFEDGATGVYPMFAITNSPKLVPMLDGAGNDIVIKSFGSGK